MNHLSEAAPKDVEKLNATPFEYGKSGDVVEFPGPIWSRNPEPLHRIQEFKLPSAEDIAAQKLAALKIVEDSLGLADFDTAIEQLLGHIRTKAEHVQILRRAVEEAQAELAQIEAEIAALVAVEPDPKNPGKPRYSNDTMRKAAVESRKTENQEYRTALRRARDAQNQRDTAQLDLDDLERRLSALRGARSYAESRLRLLASL